MWAVTLEVYNHRMKSIRLFVTLGLVLLLAPSAFAADPSGMWEWTITPPNGEQIEVSLELEHEDGKLTGTYSNRFGSSDIKDGTFEGDMVTFSVDREFDGNAFSVDYSGKLQGDSILGTFELPGFGGGEPMVIDWHATRAKE
jgi:hypothetical protein